MDQNAGWLIGCGAVLVVVVLVIYGVGQGVIFVANGVGTMLGAVSWADVYVFLEQMFIVIGIFILAILGLILAGVVAIAFQLDRDESRQAREHRKRSELAKPRIPTDLTYSEREGLRNYNTVVRPDFDDLEDLRDSD